MCSYNSFIVDSVFKVKKLQHNLFQDRDQDWDQDRDQDRTGTGTESVPL